MFLNHFRSDGTGVPGLCSRQADDRGERIKPEPRVLPDGNWYAGGDAGPATYLTGLARGTVGFYVRDAPAGVKSMHASG